MSETGEMWKSYRETQREEKAERLKLRIAEIESWGVSFGRLNGNYHLRFKPVEGTIVDFWPVNAKGRVRINKQEPGKFEGMANLKLLLGIKERTVDNATTN